MLHLARLDHFALDMKAEEVDLVTLWRELVNEEKRQFIRRKLFPEIQVQTDETIVSSDRKWLRVIFHQLLLNALRYSRQGHGDRITIHIRKEKNDTIVSVSDKGIGIPTHDLVNVFEPFSPVKTDGKRTNQPEWGSI